MAFFLTSWSGSRKGAWPKISEEERNGYIQAMKDNNVPDWYIESCGKIKYMFPKAHARLCYDGLWVGSPLKVHHPIYYYCAYFSIRAKAFDLATMSGGLDKVKAKMDEIALKKKKQWSLQCGEWPLHYLGNCQWNVGARFQVRQTGPLQVWCHWVLDWRRHPHTSICGHGWSGRERCQTAGRSLRRRMISPRRNCARGASPAPWSKRWMRWAFWVRCQRITNSASLMNWARV